MYSITEIQALKSHQPPKKADLWDKFVQALEAGAKSFEAIAEFSGLNFWLIAWFKAEALVVLHKVAVDTTHHVVQTVTKPIETAVRTVKSFIRKSVPRRLNPFAGGNLWEHFVQIAGENLERLVGVPTQVAKSMQKLACDWVVAEWDTRISRSLIEKEYRAVVGVLV